MISNRIIIQFIVCLYVVFFVSLVFPFINLGIVPRTIKGLVGIISSPFLHANFRHIVSNTVPLAVFLFVLNHFYPEKSFTVIISIVLLCGIMVWIFGREANHIGASGLIYGLAAFLVANGFVEQKFVSIAISVGVIILYGGMIWGIFPSLRSYISWESHLFGAIAGVAVAFLLKSK